MFKPKSSQSNGCTHIRQTSRKSLNKLVFQKADGNSFLGQERSANGGIQQGTTITSEAYCKTHTQEKKLYGPAEQKVWNADIRCSASP
jgi:hypothetical protein